MVISAVQSEKRVSRTVPAFQYFALRRVLRLRTLQTYYQGFLVEIYVT